MGLLRHPGIINEHRYKAETLLLPASDYLLVVYVLSIYPRIWNDCFCHFSDFGNSSSYLPFATIQFLSCLVSDHVRTGCRLQGSDISCTTQCFITFGCIFRRYLGCKSLCTSYIRVLSFYCFSDYSNIFSTHYKEFYPKDSFHHQMGSADIYRKHCCNSGCDHTHIISSDNLNGQNTETLCYIYSCSIHFSCRIC